MSKKETSKMAGRGTRRGQSTEGRGTQEGLARGEAPVGSRPDVRTQPPVQTRQAEMTGPHHDQIAERARAIWEQRGHPQGQDVEIWAEAEEQLKQEMLAGQNV